MVGIPEISILSYPRSGNHLVRYIVEFLTGRATLGGSRRDPPIHRRPKVKFLAHVVADPIGQKVHWSTGVPATTRRLLFILRNPREAILSNRRYVTDNPDYLEYVEQDAKRLLANIRLFERFSGPKLLVLYEDLVYRDPIPTLERLGRFLDAPADRLEALTRDFDKYRMDCQGAPRRPCVSTQDVNFHFQRLAPDEQEHFLGLIEVVVAYPLVQEHY